MTFACRTRNIVCTKLHPPYVLAEPKVALGDGTTWPMNCVMSQSRESICRRLLLVSVFQIMVLSL